MAVSSFWNSRVSDFADVVTQGLVGVHDEAVELERHVVDICPSGKLHLDLEPFSGFEHTFVG